MRCSACQTELVDSPKEHYKSEVHRINVHRQIYNAPPISFEEFNAKGHSSEVSVEIYNDEKAEDTLEEEAVLKSMKQKTKIQKTGQCVLCSEEESLDHYLDHGLDSDQAMYLLNMTCYVCHEGFTTKSGLKEHFINENHRTAFLKNDSLVLENGKVLSVKPRSGSSELLTVRNERRNGGQIVHQENVAKKEVEKLEIEKNKLKISLRNNLQKHFRQDWMQ